MPPEAKELQTVGKYDLVEHIAEGGMGTVYKGRDRESGQIVAIKLVPPHMLNNATLLKRFKNEFDAASKLDHPNIVRAMEYGNVDGRPFLVMEFVDGESLGQRLERETRLPEAEAIRIITLASQGLQNAHEQGMIHRDVKPDNIMIQRDGQVKLADLGLVKDIDADLNLTRTGRGLGTPHFMAPEQFRNAKNADIRCDIYSMGATLYMMVTGELPFKSCGPLDAWMKKVHNELPTPRKLLPTLSEKIDLAIRRSMMPDPQKRPASCLEFVADLTQGPQKPAESVSDPASVQDLWYLVYRDDTGKTHTVKGSTHSIRRSLAEGLLGDASNVRASRTKSGIFESLKSIAEFTDLVTGPGSSSGSKSGSGARNVQPKPRSDASTPTAPSVPRNTPVDSPPVAPREAEAPPPFDLTGSSQQTMEWVKMMILAVIALAAFLIFLYLFNS